jgi:parvulin-like peptidyl-prolyl isomerase
MLGAGCAKKPVAEVNGDKITAPEFESALNKRIEEHTQRGVSFDKKALEKAVLDELIAQKLVEQEAKERKLGVTPREVEEEVARIANALGGKKELESSLKSSKSNMAVLKSDIRKAILTNKLLDALAPSASITDAEIREFYEKSPQPFLKPERVNVRFIQTNTEEEARGVMNEMSMEKLSFDQMAERLDGKKRHVVSEYGWTQADLFSPGISRAMKDLKPGEVGGPYRGKEGYFIIRLKERQPAGVKSFEEAKEEIRNLLISEKRQAVLAHIIMEKKSRASIKIYGEAGA